MLTIVPCPQCGVPAEITERFSLPSTDGPVACVMVYCAAGHHFRMAETPRVRSEDKAFLTERKVVTSPDSSC